jgi:phosphate transport system permease protein
MATVLAPPAPDTSPPRRIRPRIRPRTFTNTDLYICVGSAAASLSLTWLVYDVLAPFSGVPGFLLLWFAAFEVVYWLAVREMEGAVAAKDRAVAAAVACVGVGIIVPLFAILAYTTWRGLQALTLGFFVHDMGGIVPQAAATAGGGIHAIIGTLEQVALAAVISVPLGVLTALFLNEVGGPMARPVRTFVDAMSGVPSVVAGLFIYATLASKFGFSGFMGALALSILMLPTVTRTCEVVLRLVPDGLREASLALGAPEWRTALRVVLPTAKAGVVTAIILGLARVIGETAPLILTTAGTGQQIVNLNPFSDPQASLPTFVYQLITSPYQVQIERAWTGALVLITLVLVLFVLARVVGGRDLEAKSRRRSRGSARASRKENA